VIENTDAEVADHKVEYADMTARLEKVIGILGEREQRVISLLYGIGQERHTMAEAASLLGLKRERVRQVRDQALRKLNKVKMSID
jgi:RNA polymerase primary sigma factor